MNKIYKLIWSKTKNMYVAVCEYAKAHGKSPIGTGTLLTVTAGILTCLFINGFSALPVYAETGILDDYISDVYNDEPDSFFYNNVSEKGLGLIGILTSHRGYASQSGLSGGANTWFAIGKNPQGENNPAIYMFLDGLLYQNEGQYRVLDESSVGAGMYLDENSRFGVKYFGVNSNDTINRTGDGATGSSAIAVGGGAVSTGNASIAVGMNAASPETNSISIGSNVNTAENVQYDGTEQMYKGHYGTTVGVHSTAVGAGSKTTALRSSAFGNDAVALGTDATAVGSQSVAHNDKEVSFGHDATDYTYLGEQYGSALYRRLTHIADGTDAHDASSVGQLNAEKNARTAEDTLLGNRIGTVANNGYYIKNSSVNNVSQNLQALDNQMKNLSDVKADISLHNLSDDGITVVRNLSKGSVNVVGADKVTVTKTDVDGVDTYTVSVKANGIVTDNNADIVSGGTVYNALQNAVGNLTEYTDTELAKKANADASNVGRNREFDNSAEWGRAIGIGTVSAYDGQLVTGNTVYNELRPAEDGTIVKTDNTTAENLTALDAQVTALTERSADAVSYDDANHNTVTLTGDAGTVITNVADGTLSANSSDTVNGRQLYQTNQNVTSLREEYNQLREEYNETERVVQTGFDVNIDGRKVKAVNPDSNAVDFASGDHIRLRNNNGTVQINVSDDGKVVSGDTGLVTGDTVHRALETASDAVDEKLNDKANTDMDNLTDTGKETVRELAKGSVRVVGVGEVNVNKTTESNTDVYAVSIHPNGTVADGDTGLVTGDTVYNAFQELKNVYANKDASNVDATVWGEKLGTGTVDGSDNKLVTGRTVAGETRIVSDGNYIRKENTAGENLSTLDRVLKETRDLAEASALTGTDAFAVHYSNIDKSVVSLQGENGTVITNIKDGELSETSSDAVTGKQLHATNEKVNANTERIDDLTDKMGTVSDGNYVSADKTFGENIGALDTQLKTVSDGLDEMRVDVNHLRDTVTETVNGKADTDLGNITEEGKDVISDIAKNSVTVRGTGAVTVSSATEGKTTVYTVGVTADGRIEDGNTGLVSGDTVYESIRELRDGLGDGLDTKADTDLSNLTDTGKDYIRELMQSDLDKKADKTDLNTKANVDASNIDVSAWEERLGTGVVAPGNTGLINGDTAYQAFRILKDSEVVKADFDNGVIGIGNDSRYDGIDLIDVSKSDGTARIIKGVATDSHDPSSVSNVAYVNAVGQNILDRIGDGLTRMDDKVNKVGAGAAAMASLVPGSFEDDSKWNISAAVGNYRDATAGAVGAFYKPVGNVTVAIKGSFGNGENMIGGGVGVALNKGSMPGVTKAVMVRTINAQAREIQSMKSAREQDRAMIANQSTRIEEQTKRIERLETALRQMMDDRK